MLVKKILMHSEDRALDMKASLLDFSPLVVSYVEALNRPNHVIFSRLLFQGNALDFGQP